MQRKLDKVMPISLSCCKCATLFICDANTKAIGSSLNQFDSESKTWKPLTFFSETLNPCQKHYSKYERKLLAMFLSVCHCFGFASRSRCHPHYGPQALGVCNDKNVINNVWPSNSSGKLYFSVLSIIYTHCRNSDAFTHT